MHVEVGICHEIAGSLLVNDVELEAKVAACRRDSCSPWRFGSPRRLLSTTAKVQPVAELQLAEEVCVRRGSPARPGPRRLLPTTAKVQLDAEILER